MEQFKRAKVVRLSTNEKSKSHHLYITSDDEIKEGDWITDNKKVYKAPNVDAFIGLYKIIATTDSSLKVTKSATGYTETRSRTFYSKKSLPQPSQSFIEVFVREYNKGNVITDVLVEYEIDIYAGKPNTKFCYPKVNPKDNTITIKKVKDSWNREEIESLLEDCWMASQRLAYKHSNLTFFEWIKENL